MTAKSCQTCFRPATHRARSGWLLCDRCTARLVARLHRQLARSLPQPLEAQRSLDLGMSA